MKKGQRPSKHYRKVKTKHGRRKVLVNKSIPKKKKIKRSRGNKDPFRRFPISKTEDVGLLRQLVTAQEEQNILKSLEREADMMENLGRGLEKRQEQDQLKRRGADLENLQRKARGEEETRIQSITREQRKSSKEAKRRLSELDFFSKELASDTPKQAMDFASKRDIKEKLEKSLASARRSDDPILLRQIESQVQAIRDKLKSSEQVLEKKEFRKKLKQDYTSFSEGKMSPSESKLFKVGLEMLELPEVKTKAEFPKQVPIEEYKAEQKAKFERALQSRKKEIGQKYGPEAVDLFERDQSISEKQLIAFKRENVLRSLRGARQEAQARVGLGNVSAARLKRLVSSYNEAIGKGMSEEEAALSLQDNIERLGTSQGKSRLPVRVLKPKKSRKDISETNEMSQKEFEEAFNQ